MVQSPCETRAVLGFAEDPSDIMGVWILKSLLSIGVLFSFIDCKCEKCWSYGISVTSFRCIEQTQMSCVELMTGREVEHINDLWLWSCATKVHFNWSVRSIGVIRNRHGVECKLRDFSKFRHDAFGI